jgi:predicted transcriptional regulator
MSVTSIRLQPEIESPLEELAKKLDRSKNYLINQAIKEYVVRQSVEECRWEETLQALSSIKAGRSVPESEVTDWLESWGTDKESSPPNS